MNQINVKNSQKILPVYNINNDSKLAEFCAAQKNKKYCGMHPMNI